jgi:RND family efflux transporter MFP subunit
LLKNTNCLVFGASPGPFTVPFADTDEETMNTPCRTRAIRTSILLAPALIATVCCSCSRQNVQAQELKPTEATVVAVTKVALDDISRQVVLTAEFTPFQEIDVMAKVAGYVKRINVDVGDRVQEGQLLATIEVPEMADDQSRAQSMLNRSHAELDRAGDELKRSESSHNIAHVTYTRLSEVAKQKPGLIAQQEIDDAQSKDLVAEAQVSAAKSSVSAAEQQVQVSQAEVQKVKTLFEYTRVSAPFSGVVTRRYADTGSMIQAGISSSTQAMPVVKLSQNTLLRLILPVPESVVPSIHVGQKVEVRVPTLGRSLPGRIARFADKLSSSTRTMDTEVDVPNSNLVLVPGMYAQAILTLDQRKDVLSIPIPSVDLSSDETSGQVWVVTRDGRIDIRKVQLGIQNETKVEVRSGLSEGDLVVTGNRTNLKPGQEVQPKVSDSALPATS